MIRKVLVLLLGLSMVSWSGPVAEAAPPGQRDVIVQLFEWNWSSVGRDCGQVLGPKGYGAVQVSPPQEHVALPGAGYPWWQDYQPVSYKLENARRGTRAQFVRMVNSCHPRGQGVPRLGDQPHDRLLGTPGRDRPLPVAGVTQASPSLCRFCAH